MYNCSQGRYLDKRGVKAVNKQQIRGDSLAQRSPGYRLVHTKDPPPVLWCVDLPHQVQCRKERL